MMLNQKKYIVYSENIEEKKLNFIHKLKIWRDKRSSEDVRWRSFSEIIASGNKRSWGSDLRLKHDWWRIKESWAVWKITKNESAFTLQVLMHKSNLLPISNFLARLFTFTLDWYLISVFTLIPTQKDWLQWSLYCAHDGPLGFKWPCYSNYLYNFRQMVIIIC